MMSRRGKKKTFCHTSFYLFFDFCLIFDFFCYNCFCFVSSLIAVQWNLSLVELWKTHRHLKCDKEPQLYDTFCNESQAKRLETAGLIFNNRLYFISLLHVLKILIWKVNTNYSCQINVVEQKVEYVPSEIQWYRCKVAFERKMIK